METILCICMGVGMAAACGFRVFVPLLVLSLAAGAGHVTLAPSFSWIATTPALIVFSAATVLEIGAYYVPWLDNFLDSIATPAAVVAGTIVTASMMTNMSPLMQWGLAVIAGGGIAGVVQGATVLTRTVSTTASAGLANPLVATAELGFAGFFSFLALVLPPLAVILVLGLLVFMVIKIRRRFFVGRKKAIC
jgi:hypothetical protein